MPRTAERSGARLWLVAFIGFSALFAGWAFATPYNGPPDESQHVLRAAGVVRGEIFTRQDINGGYQNVPDSLYPGFCFPTKIDVPASCEPEPGGDERIRELDTTAARYNPVYYAVTGWPLLPWPNWRGIMLTRLLTGAAVAALLASALVGAVRWTRHRALVAGVVAATTPMVAHLGGAVNPQGIEIAAGAALFVSLMALVHEQRAGINRAAVVLAGVSAAVLVTPKFTGLMWILVIFGVVLVPSSKDRLRELWRSAVVKRWSVVVVLATAASLAWTVIAKPADPTGWDRKQSIGMILKHAFLHAWPNNVYQMISVPGWAELEMPRLVYVVWIMVVGLPLLAGFALGNRVERWRLAALAFGAFVPLIALELLSANRIWFFNQGRYFLTAAVGLPMLAGYVLVRHGFTAEHMRSMTRLFALLTLPIHVGCLLFAMARWRSGLKSFNPLEGEWTPPWGAVLPIVLVVVGAGVLFAAYWWASRVPERVHTQPAEPDQVTAPAV
ncbi:hypothetical protein BBK82_13800 [Lentzea guizhouensis]|uniref:DUF2142 domain-containing protein n=1 Tax=Lentzea guizhouensis TaxID=1586287 RepID=A0A1B2HGY7_9PSEU|nr:DUF2142 domain-containing protein [Lentzea guizhouensis]ANZ36985.1 hypothetical protein BBK82_13800 [Lentzea guizhouensis]